jgi:hypothetical protein
LAAIDESSDQAHAVVTVVEDKLRDNFSYALAHSPCEHVYQTGVCIYPKGVAEAFPKDAVLQEMRIEGYVGSTIHNPQSSSRTNWHIGCAFQASDHLVWTSESDV